MSIIQQSATLIRATAEPIASIVESARLCYDSTGTAEDDIKLVKTLLKRGHHAMLEMAEAKIRFVCDRGVSHELVRHRMASFAQASTRFIDMSDREVPCILPPGLDAEEGQKVRDHYAQSDSLYKWLRARGKSPQIARSVFPTGLATTIDVKANFREWLHILRLRTAKGAHPMMREVMGMAQKLLQDVCPIVFGEDAEIGYY